ncbi:unnamed protein product [Rodentolepis nana]|uniref:RNase H domain-containing protein n=1 Tax=Rodentolepis nana TaxID=102285 RepID=A0A0R3THF2_RODNA|nr:unnamed protein product [Rodentolepis nana]
MILQINGSKSSLMGRKAKETLVQVSILNSSHQWLQVFTDGSYIENQATVGAGVYSEFITFYAAVGHNRSAFEGNKDSTMPIMLPEYEIHQSGENFRPQGATNIKLEQKRNSGQWHSEARTKEKQWTVALSTYPTGQESKPLLSLTSKKGETVDSGTLRGRLAKNRSCC